MNIKNDKLPSTVIVEPGSSETTTAAADKSNQSDRHELVKRRSFLKGLGIAGMALSAGPLLMNEAQAQSAQSQGSQRSSGKLSRGDAAILRLLAAAELIEADLWQQYAEL